MVQRVEPMTSPRPSRAFCCIPCLEALERDPCKDKQIVTGNAFDVIVVKSENGFFSNQNFNASFSRTDRDQHRLMLELGNASSTPGDEFIWAHCNPASGAASRVFELDLDDGIGDGNCDILSQMSGFLRDGRNPIRYLLLSSDQVVGVAHADVYLWSTQDRIVVSDIDGTITRSNAHGIYDTILTERYVHCHDAVCHFFSTVTVPAKTRIMYVTSRPTSLATRTRKFLNNLRQRDHRLPEGPVLGFTGNFRQLLVMELISYQTHHFKAEILWRNVVQPFKKAGLHDGVFLGAFGNTIMDIQAYGMASVPLNRIYLLEKAQIHSFDNSDQGEFVNLTPNAENSNSWGPEMSPGWYRARVGSVFTGYDDLRLMRHIEAN